MIKLLLAVAAWFGFGLHQAHYPAEEERYRRRLQVPARRLDAGVATQMAGNNTGESTAVLDDPTLDSTRPALADTPAEPLLVDEVPQRVIDVVINLRLAYEQDGIYAIRVVGLEENPVLNAAEAAKLGFLLDNASKVVASVRTAAGFSA